MSDTSAIDEARAACLATPPDVARCGCLHPLIAGCDHEATS